MPAKSKAQQRFMGMVHSYNKGDMKDAPASVKKAAKGMTKKSAKDFASTKHKGKPEHVDESLRRLIRQEIQNALSVNEKVSSPFSQHLKGAQEEVEYMISEHPGAAEEGVYDKPKQAIKFLQVAQKALGKIT
jgi:hypothetical protein|tara:strand:+ start:6068 stop:6463 length:396 start_codon:yes stop_codon:yes gene_type:complete